MNRNLMCVSLSVAVLALVSAAGCSSSRPAGSQPDTVESIDQVTFLNPAEGYGLFSTTRGSTVVLAVAATTNGGRSFASPRQVTTFDGQSGTPGRSLAFDGAGDAFVYGPQLFTSHDNGSTWAARPGFDDVVSVTPLGRSVWLLRHSCSEVSGTCRVSVEASGDGGRTWSPVALPNGETTDGTPAMIRTSLSAALIVIPPPPPPSGATAPASSPTLMTTDGGRTWSHGTAPCAGLSAFLSSSPGGTVWLACGSEPGAGNQAKELARSADGGMHWSLGGCSTGSEAWSGSGCYFSGTLNAGYLGDLVATSPTTAFIAGGRNDVLVTRDGGRTWAQTAPPIGDMDSGTGPLCFADPDHGWAVAGAFNAGPANALWSTTDGGRTWTAVWRSVTKG